MKACRGQVVPGRKGVEVRSSQIEMALHVVKRPAGEWDLELLISARELTLAQKEDRYLGGIRLSVVQMDRAGKILDQTMDSIGLSLKQEKLPEYLVTGMPMEKTVKAKRG